MFMCLIYVRRIVLRPKGSKFMLQEYSVTLRAFDCQSQDITTKLSYGLCGECSESYLTNRR